MAAGKNFAMLSVSTAWPVRLLATVITLALLAVSVLGAYTHAAGHVVPVAARPSALAGTADHGGAVAVVLAAAASGLRHLGGTGDSGKSGAVDTDCCDSICHGGHAILAADTVVTRAAPAAPAIQPAAPFDGAHPSGPERPPKATLLPA